MRSMTLRTSHDEVLDATEHLPTGATLVIHDFDWDGYEQLLDALGDRSHFRVSYDSGRLEILSPSSPHEQYARLMDLIVFVFCEVHELKVKCLGQTTWRKKPRSKGLEADACYYLKNEELIRGKRDINLESDPPPDIAVEIDLTRSSFRKQSIYTALRIPEIWRYDGRSLRIYTLTKGQYTEIHESSFLPGLTDAMLTQVLEASATGETMDVLKAFRKRLQESGR